MRFQDFLADHFGFQYAVPRTNGRKPTRSRWSEYGQEFLLIAGQIALGAVVLLVWCVKTFSAKPGQIPVAVILLAALLSILSGLYFCFLI